MTLSKFITQLSKDFPDFNFTYGKRFSFRPPKTIIIGPEEGENTALLVFHELGHALSGKYQYNLGIERLKIESLAWQEAKKAYEACKSSGKYPNLPSWDQDFVEDNLDTYRNWLHQKSKCPSCGLTMYQNNDGWHCPYCSTYYPPIR